MYTLTLRTRTKSYTFTVPLSLAVRLVKGMGQDCLSATMHKFNQPLMELKP